MNIKEETLSDTLKNIKDVFWTNTAMGWMWRELFGKKKAKQAPPHFSTGGSNSMYINPQNYLRAKKAAPKGFLTIPAPPPISTYNTSSLNTNLVGKPLVIKNWDRLTGMNIPMPTNSLGMNHYWIVTHAGQTTDGYECILENSGGRFGNSNRAVTFIVYSDMYDSHRVMVKCGGRISTMDIDVFKDPHNMLYTIGNEFQEKFR